MHNNPIMASERWARAHILGILNAIISLLIVAGNLALFGVAMKGFIRNLDNMDVDAQFMHQVRTTAPKHTCLT